MNINSGFKAVDKLVKVHGVSCEYTDNPFQLAIAIPPTVRANDPNELRQLIQPFGLQTFPHALWLALQQQITNNPGLAIHRFTLPHLNQVLCWVMVNAQGKVVEKAYPLKKPKYIQAAKALIGTLLGMQVAG